MTDNRNINVSKSSYLLTVVCVLVLFETGLTDVLGTFNAFVSGSFFSFTLKTIKNEYIINWN